MGYIYVGLNVADSCGSWEGSEPDPREGKKRWLRCGGFCVGLSHWGEGGQWVWQALEAEI